jgi:hypothetical protein
LLIYVSYLTLLLMTEGIRSFEQVF